MLKSFLGWYLGIAPAGSGQGTSWKLTWRGTEIAGGWWLALLAAAATFAVVLYYVEMRRTTGRLRWILPLLRLATLFMFAVFAGELSLEVVRTGLPTVAVMVDVSASMNLEDKYRPAVQETATRRLLDEVGLAAPTRLNLAKAILSRHEYGFLTDLGRRYRVRLYEFAEAARPLGGRESVVTDDAEAAASLIGALKAEGPQTRPGPSLRHVLDEFRGAPPAAVILLTDGVASVDPGDRLSQTVTSARDRCPPLFPIGLGSSEPARDLQLDDPLTDPVVFVGDPVTFDFHVTAFDFANQSVDVFLRRGRGAEMLARTSVRVSADGVPVPVRMSFTPRDEGDYEFVLETPPQEGETNVDNNKSTMHVRVRREQIRVLLAERWPRWEYRHLKGVLERDPTIELRTVLQESDLSYQQEDRTALPSFPAAREDLFAYDVVILGDVDLKYLHPGALADLREFVAERGGGLILLGGERHNPYDFRGTPLADLVPVDLETIAPPAPPDDPVEFRSEPTLAGYNHPIFQLADDEAGNRRLWSELPPLQWALDVPHAKPAAIVLARRTARPAGPGSHPLIVLQRFGAGEVLFHATDEFWQWRKRTEDLYYGRYWLQAVRFLCRSRLLAGVRGVELTANRTAYDQGEPVRLRLRFVDRRLLPTDGQTVTAAVEHGAGHTEMVTLERTEQSSAVYQGTFTPTAAGAYHTWLAEPALGETPPSVDFRVEIPQHELRQRNADLDDLARAAELSGGAAISFGDVGQVLSRLPAGKALPVANAEQVPLWSRIEALLLLTGLLGTEWLLRKRARLV